MARRFGLRTEIIVNLLLLMGAALLFSGLLLLRVAERELLAERVASLRGQMQLLARLVVEEDAAAGAAEALSEAAQRQLLAAFSELQPSALFAVDRQLRLRSASSHGAVQSPEQQELLRARFEGRAVERLQFASALVPGTEIENHLWVSVPLLQRGEFNGALQARFSLAGLDARLRTARRVFLLYAGLYGGILFGFGLWLLSNTVVRPVRALMAATRRVAAGDLEPNLASSGPREIAELAEDFNAMTAALRSNRQQMQEQIVSLERINTELLRTQDDLVRSEKLASVGRLAAGMAHEVGNPLGAVLGYLELLRRRTADPPSGELAARALTEAERIDRLVRDLLDYAAPGPAEAERLDPVGVLHEARSLLQHQGALDGVTLVDELPLQLAPVLISRHKLLQVLVNLLLNARDADPQGTIRLRGGEEHGRVWLAVADGGIGMDNETQRQIFDPFFTTKAPGRGRGLGLSVCLRIVEEAGGELEVVSHPGAGSCFSVRLPRAEGEG